MSPRDEVDTVADAALAAGGTEVDGPEDHGFLYSRGFFDLTGPPLAGHVDGTPAAEQQGPEGVTASTQDAGAPA